MNETILPDSRLRRPIGTIMGDWPMPDGTTIRCEMEPAYCVKCGEKGVYVPLENTVHATYLCHECYQQDPTIFNGMVASDEQFCRDVTAEMAEKYGRTLTDVEIFALLEQGRLGSLESLLRDSPYPSADKRSRRC